MRAVLAITLALVLTACGQGVQPAAGPAPGTPEALDIEAGRYSVMLGQIHDLTTARPGVGEPDPREPAAIARSLREAVWSYNLERSGLCAKGLFTDVACGPAYAPMWISEPDSATPTLEELQSRSTALGGEVQRLWGAVCDDARTRETDEQARQLVCAIE